MKRTASILFAVSMAIGLAAGVNVFSFGPAVGSQFGGSTDPECGTGLACSSSTYTATDATGPSFACSGTPTQCVDLGTGANNQLCTDVDGHVVVGCGAGQPVVEVGTNVTLEGNGYVRVVNGFIEASLNTEITDPFASPVDVVDTDGFRINSTSAVKGVVLAAVTINIGSIAANTCSDVTATVTGVEANDKVFITRDHASTANFSVSDAYVTNAGTDEVTFRACNPSVGAVDPASGSFLFMVVR